MNAHADTVEIAYQFRLPDGRDVMYDLLFDPKSFALLNTPPKRSPEWARLEHEQCPNCPLDAAEHTYCPVAVHLAPVLRDCGNLRSYEHVHLHVIRRERIVTQYTSAQHGLAAIMGLIMPSCGCPRIEFLRPMARFQLLVANEVETLYLALATYALSRLLRARSALPAESSLDGLALIGRDLEVVYGALAKRLGSACSQDAALNALVTLTGNAQLMMLAPNEHLDEIEALFVPYLNGRDPEEAWLARQRSRRAPRPFPIPRTAERALR